MKPHGGKAPLEPLFARRLSKNNWRFVYLLPISGSSVTTRSLNLRKFCEGMSMSSLQTRFQLDPNRRYAHWLDKEPAGIKRMREAFRELKHQLQPGK